MEVCFSYSYKLTNSYGLSIFILSIVVNIALLPFYYLAEKWKLQEKIIKKEMESELSSIKKYSSKREKYYYTQEVYKRFGYNPLSSIKVSFGFLIQIPFFFAAYHLLSHFPDWAGAGFLVFQDLSKPDQLISLFGYQINLLPIVMTAANLVSAYVYTTHMDHSEKIQLWLLAAVFLIVLYNSPAGLVLYWTINNVFSLAKNIIGQKLNLNFLTLQDNVKNSHLTEYSNTTFKKLNYYCDKTIKYFDFPITLNIGLFFSAIFSLIIFESIKNKSSLTADLMFSAITILLFIICIAPALKLLRSTQQDLRQKLHKTLVLVLLISFSVCAISELFGIVPKGIHIRMIITAILLSLAVLLYIPLILKWVKFPNKMPNQPWLYMAAMCLSLFIICITNPLNFYTTTTDFSDEIFNDVVKSFLKYFSAFFILSILLYVLVDKKSRKLLTLLSVFSVVCIVSYSSFLDVGLLDHFILNNKDELIQPVHKFIIEILSLGLVFIITSSITIYYRKLVSFITVTMIVTSIYIAMSSINEIEAIPQTKPYEENYSILNFSKEQNILIIMLDGYPGWLIEKFQNENPKILEPYEGFVWYPNTITNNAGTWGAIAAVSGGHKYTVENINNLDTPSLEQVLTDAYSIYPNAFIPMGYDVAYINPQFSSCEKIHPRINCALSLAYRKDNQNKQYESLGENKKINIPVMLTMVSIFKSIPYFMKPIVYDKGNWLSANSNWSATVYSYKLPDWAFLNKLAQESNFDSMSKTLKYIQLQIPHPPYGISTDCSMDNSTATLYSEAYCTLKIIGVLLERMKENGVYNDTKIVLVSDHGWWSDNPMFPNDFQESLQEGYRRRANAGFLHPLLLVKDFNTKGNLSRSEIFRTNADVPSIICSTISTCNGVQDYLEINTKMSRELIFNITEKPENFNKENKFEIKESYKIKNNIFDKDNWERIY